MAEYIEREKATCQDCYHYKVCSGFGFVLDPLHGGVICDDFERAADVVEVVRCKDCKRCYKHTTKRYKQPMWICMRLDLDSFAVRPDDFCSYGERRDTDE